jgi:2-phospho-L-lactate guanylyltransferase
VAHVLVPVKRLNGAKTRLAGVLDGPAREQLMLEMLREVVAAVREADVGPMTLVSSEAIDVGVPRFDDRGLPWNEALTAAMRDVTEECVAIVSADLPLLRAEEVAELVAATPGRGLAIARAKDGGTNAVAMRPPALVQTRFGEPGSAAVHAALGVEAVVLDLPGLAFDVDTPEDLAAWR